jgi:hypothetical protein
MLLLLLARRVCRLLLGPPQLLILLDFHLHCSETVLATFNLSSQLLSFAFQFATPLTTMFSTLGDAVIVFGPIHETDTENLTKYIPSKK